jgi:hypothetical protein
LVLDKQVFLVVVAESLSLVAVSRNQAVVVVVSNRILPKPRAALDGVVLPLAVVAVAVGEDQVRTTVPERA